MVTKLKNITKNPLFSGSLVMLLGGNLNNLILYFYHLIMGRLLGPSDYGALVSLLSIIGLITIIPQSLGPTVVKFISAAKDDKHISTLIDWFYTKTVIISIIITLIILLSSPLISSFVKIGSVLPVILMSFTVIFSLQTIIIRSVLQGLLEFDHIIVSIVSESAMKLAIGVILVILGLTVNGAVVGIVASVIFSWWISKRYIDKYITGHVKNVATNIYEKDLIAFSLPMLVQTFAFASLFSTDLVLVKHFFSPHDAGIYASVSGLGKIAIYGVNPVIGVMFALISNRSSKKERWINIFIYSLFTTLSMVTALLLFYKFLPSLAINLLYGKSYLEGSSVLFNFGVFVAILSICSLFTNLFFSLGKTVISYFILVAAIFQVVGIILFHNNLVDVIYVSTTVATVLLISLVLYFIYGYKNLISSSSSL